MAFRGRLGSGVEKNVHVEPIINLFSDLANIDIKRSVSNNAPEITFGTTGELGKCSV